MFPRTKFKLDEARFFQHRFTETKGHETSFVYYLDAFISALTGVLHAMETEYKQSQRRNGRKGKTIQDSNLEQIQNLKKHALIQDVRNPTHHGVLLLPVKAIPNSLLIDTNSAWSMSVKVFNKLTGQIVVNSSFSSAGRPNGISEVLVSVSTDVKLKLSELTFVGDEKSCTKYEVEREFNWIIDLGENNINDCIKFCNSYFSEIELLSNKIMTEALYDEGSH